jgi:hypothetical protein
MFSQYEFDNAGVVFGVDQNKIKNLVRQYIQQRGLLNQTDLNAPLPH